MSTLTIPWFLRRILHAAILLFGVSVLSFVLGDFAAGSFFDDLKLNPQISPDTIARLESRYRIGQPFVMRYGSWASSAARGDFGTSLAYQRPVATILWPRALSTLTLTGAAALVTWVFALPLGILAARRPQGATDRAASVAAALFVAIPELVLALFLMYTAVRLGWIPMTISLALPLAVLVAGGLPVVFRHSRAAVAEAERMPFIQAARAHGIAGSRLWLLYILPAAAHPLLSLMGLWIGGLIGGSLVVETLFGRPGLGPIFLEAVFSRDLDIITAVMLLSALFLVAGNLASDLLLGILDPRVRRVAE
jgi:peptide/nickel transport system permease protein